MRIAPLLLPAALLLLPACSDSLPSHAAPMPLPPMPAPAPAPANLAPVAKSDRAALRAGETLEAGSVLANDLDPEGASLRAVLEQAPAAGTLELHADGSYRYTAAAAGDWVFRYRADDGQARSEPVEVRLHVSPLKSAIAAIAHRGFSSLYPENTLLAFEQAVLVGAEMVETDVQRTADGALVLMHDITLERTTDAETLFPDRAPWNVSDFTLAEIKTLDAGSSKFPIYAGEPVPTLRELLDAIKDRAGLLLELKNAQLYPGIEAAVIAEMEAAGWTVQGMPTQNLVIQSFNWEAVRRYHQLAPATATAILGGKLPGDAELADIASFARDANLSFANYNADAVAKLRQYGLGMNPYTPDFPQDIAALLELPIDGVITNVPPEVTLLRLLPLLPLPP